MFGSRDIGSRDLESFLDSKYQGTPKKEGRVN